MTVNILCSIITAIITGIISTLSTVFILKNDMKWIIKIVDIHGKQIDSLMQRKRR